MQNNPQNICKLVSLDLPLMSEQVLNGSWTYAQLSQHSFWLGLFIRMQNALYAFLLTKVVKSHFFHHSV